MIGTEENNFVPKTNIEEKQKPLNRWQMTVSSDNDSILKEIIQEQKEEKNEVKCQEECDVGDNEKKATSCYTSPMIKNNWLFIFQSVLQLIILVILIVFEDTFDEMLSTNWSSIFFYGIIGHSIPGARLEDEGKQNMFTKLCRKMIKSLRFNVGG